MHGRGAALGLLVLPLTGCAAAGSPVPLGTDDPGAVAAAADRAESLADAMGSPTGVRDLTAAALITEELNGASDVDAMSWSGRSGDEAGGGARMVLRIRGEGFTDTGQRTAAVRCFALVIRTWRLYDTHDVRPVACPAAPVPPQPDEAPEALPADVAARLTRALSTGASTSAVATALRADLPSYATVDVVPWHGGLVAAVGAPAVQDCAVAVRDDHGAVRIEPVDRTQVQPGEIGCRAQLVTDPAR